MSLPAIPGAVQGSSDTPSGSSPTLPPINGGKSGGRGTVDISQLLGETLSKLISEKRGTNPELLTMGGDEGRISLKEFGDAVVPLGLAPAEVSLIFGHFDKKGSGFISFEELHRELCGHWRVHRPSGRGLYARASERARELGYTLALTGASGHRLADHPHEVRAKLRALERCPRACAWVVEIHLLDEERARGAFHEDLLC